MGEKVPLNMRKMCHEIHIILHMGKVSYRHLHSIGIFFSIQWFCLQTLKGLIRLCGCAGLSRHSLSAYAKRHIFIRRNPNYMNFWKYKKNWHSSSVGRASALWPGGCGFNPQPSHSKDFNKSCRRTASSPAGYILYCNIFIIKPYNIGHTDLDVFVCKSFCHLDIIIQVWQFSMK